MELNLASPANMEEIVKAKLYLPVIEVLNSKYANPEASRMAMLQALGILDGYKIGVLMGAGNKAQRAKVADDTSIVVAAQLVEHVFPMLDFIYNNEPFYDNPLPIIKHKGISYAGPSKRLIDQTAEEWMICHQLQHRYSKSQDISILRELVACIYHPASKGKRGQYSDAGFEAQREAFKTLPDAVVYGVYLWYTHCDAWWPNKFPHLFSDGEENKGGEPSQGLEVRHIVFELTGNTIGTEWDTVKLRTRQELFYALDRLDQKREEAEANKEK